MRLELFLTTQVKMLSPAMNTIVGWLLQPCLIHRLFAQTPHILASVAQRKPWSAWRSKTVLINHSLTIINTGNLWKIEHPVFFLPNTLSWLPLLKWSDTILRKFLKSRSLKTNLVWCTISCSTSTLPLFPKDFGTSLYRWNTHASQEWPKQVVLVPTLILWMQRRH